MQAQELLADITVNRVHDADKMLIIIVAQITPAFASHGRHDWEHLTIFDFAGFGQIDQKFASIRIGHAPFGQPFLAKQINNPRDRWRIFRGHIRNSILADTGISVEVINNHPLVHGQIETRVDELLLERVSDLFDRRVNLEKISTRIGWMRHCSGAPEG